MQTKWEGSNHTCFLRVTLDGEKVVGRYAFAGPPRQTWLLHKLRKLQLCWLPYSWSREDMKTRGLSWETRHVPSKLREKRNPKFKTTLFSVEYYPYVPYTLADIRHNLSIYQTCFGEIKKLMLEAHRKEQIYYMDFHPKNILSRDGKTGWRCCDIESCFIPANLQDGTLSEDFTLSCPDEEVDLFGFSIWKLGMMFFKLISGKSLNLNDADEEKEKVEDILCPQMEDDTLTLNSFLKQYPKCVWVSQCLLLDPKKRISSFTS
jgi:hypothetical protein